jgi:predicted ATP-grasp superfamily ATP-dependent carboligase
MLHAVAEDFARLAGVHVTTLVDDRCPEPPGHECRHVTSAEERDAFCDCAAHADATLVIAPEFDGLLLQHSRWVLDTGGRLLGALPAAIELGGDKLALVAHWQRRSVRTPGTALACDRVPAIGGPPWVCKPRHGAGSQATFLVRDPADWPAVFARARAEWPTGDLLVQTYVPGLAASVAFLCAPGRCVPLMPAEQCLSDDGRFTYRGGRLPLPALLHDRAVRVAQAAIQGVAGLQGYIGVDLILGAAEDGSEDHAIEINPRLTTSYIGLRRLCRGSLAQAWLDVLGGREVALEWQEGRVEFEADGRVLS